MYIDVAVSRVILTLVKITSEIFVPDVDESVVLDIQMFFLLLIFVWDR